MYDVLVQPIAIHTCIVDLIYRLFFHASAILLFTGLSLCMQDTSVLSAAEKRQCEKCRGILLSTAIYCLCDTRVG